MLGNVWHECVFYRTCRHNNNEMHRHTAQAHTLCIPFNECRFIIKKFRLGKQTPFYVRKAKSFKKKKSKRTSRVRCEDASIQLFYIFFLCVPRSPLLFLADICIHNNCFVTHNHISRLCAPRFQWQSAKAIMFSSYRNFRNTLNFTWYISLCIA